MKKKNTDRSSQITKRTVRILDHNYLPVSGSKYEISQIIAEVTISSVYLTFSQWNFHSFALFELYTPVYHCNIINNYRHCERFEPRGHFKSRLRLIVQVNIALNRTVVVDSDCVSTTRAVVIFRVKVNCITLVDGIILWLLI